MERNNILCFIGVMTMFSCSICSSVHKTMEQGNEKLSNSEIIQLLTDDSVKYWIGVNIPSSFKFTRKGLRFNSYNKKGDEEFTSQQDILFSKVFNVDSMRIFIYWKLPHPVGKLYPYVDYKIRRISKDTLVIGDYTDFVFLNCGTQTPSHCCNKSYSGRTY